MVCFSKQAAGALMNRGNGSFIKDRVLDSSKHKVMVEILLHFHAGHPLQVRPANHP
jgi:hypothetical protein